ncbi:MAG: hypothetical protein QOK40_3056 [Miltoncostaeaceae bacterium]|jgi:hypothetical protein|nr:hypothetical protein [Miltoncostaeaceae bacterium]
MAHGMDARPPDAPGRRLRLATASTLAALAALAVPAASHGAMSIVYDVDAAAFAIVSPADGSPGLGPDRGAFRQEGSSGHLFGGAADAPNRIGKVSGAALATMTVSQIAAALRSQIDAGCVIDGRDYGCTSGLVAVDEIGNAFNDGPPPKTAPRRFASRREARAAGPPPPVPLPPVDQRSAGARFSKAMALLDTLPAPGGGSYASRVHVYVAPAAVAAIGSGRGPNHNLGRDGKPHFSTWRAVMPGLARAGGMWLEMYHGSSGGTVSAFTAAEWRTGPRDILDVYSSFGGDVSRAHFVLTGTGMPAGAPRGCTTPMACTWALASLAGANARILANGPAAYRVGAQAAEWIGQYNLRF